MEKQSFVLRSATVADARQIQEILEEVTFKGGISLKYTRRTDAYLSFMKEGEQVYIVVAESAAENKVVGFGAVAIRHLFINGRPQKAAYFLGMRLAKAYQHKLLRIHEGYTYLLGKCKESSLIYTSILSENVVVQKMLEKKRSFMPNYVPITNYTTYILAPKGKAIKGDGLIFKKCDIDELPKLLVYLNEEGRKYNGFPVVLANDFVNGKLVSDNYYLLLSNNEIVAAAYVNDQKQYKQIYVEGYNGYFKILHRLPAVLSILGYPKLEAVGNRVHYVSISNLLVKNNDLKIAAVFLKNIIKISKQYSYITIGLPESHPLNRFLIKQTSIKYHSKIYSINGNDAMLKDNILYFDSASL